MPAPTRSGLYRRLRRGNPSPFAAFLRFGERTVVSSSPERFLSVDRERKVQARPIKGTISRAADDPAEDERRREWLRSDEKTQAEHLMIVDLLRNDIGRVCDVDSVSVPGLMTVEPYATVHQLVSTIEGTLEAGRSAVECVRACFPGGSMTGAPKERTMEIIDDIEAEARGVYSGSIGYFGLDGNTDLNIVIRTIVMRPGRTTIGAGGAIVMQSDPQDEFDEMLLKARAPMAAIAADGNRQRLRGRLERRAGADGGGGGSVSEAAASEARAAVRPATAGSGWRVREAGEADVPACRRRRRRAAGRAGRPHPDPGRARGRGAGAARRPGWRLAAGRRSEGGEIVGVLSASWQRAIHVPGATRRSRTSG